MAIMDGAGAPAGEANESGEQQQQQPQATPPATSNTEGYWKRQAEKAQKELDTHRKAQMSEVDRLKAELAEERSGRSAADQRADRTLMQTRFELEASKAGCHHPEDAYRLLPADALRVENGQVVGIKQALKSLQESKGYLFGEQPKQQPVAGGGNPPGGGPALSPHAGINDWIRSQI